jgi:hypothetical protein
VRTIVQRRRLGQACDANDPLCGLTPDWYSQLVGPMGPSASMTPLQMLQAFQVQGQVNPSSLPTGQQAYQGVMSAQMSARLSNLIGCRGSLEVRFCSCC